jgi:hypothetical protein
MGESRMGFDLRKSIGRDNLRFVLKRKSCKLDLKMVFSDTFVPLLHEDAAVIPICCTAWPQCIHTLALLERYEQREARRRLEDALGKLSERYEELQTRDCTNHEFYCCMEDARTRCGQGGVSMAIETQEQALAEAQDRWGKNAFVYIEAGKKVVCEKHSHWTKGKLDGRIRGYGNTWDEAFADADSRALNPSAKEKPSGK